MVEVSHNEDGTLNIHGISLEHLEFIGIVVADTVSRIMTEFAVQGEVGKAAVWLEYGNAITVPVSMGIQEALESEDFEPKPCECPVCVINFLGEQAENAEFN